MDDKVLLQRIKTNDTGAFDILMERYYGALCSFSLRLLTERGDAEDNVQDVFVKLWENRKKIEVYGSLKNYLYVSARNLAMNRLRSQKHFSGFDTVAEIEDKSPYYVIEDEKNRLLLEAIRQLPPRTAQVIMMSRDGKSQEEIARDMGITVSTVKLLKSRGVKRLKETLGSALVVALLGII